MSNPHRELPGFYYDPQRKKYFPLTKGIEQHFKRQKVNATEKDELLYYWDNCFKLYEDYALDPTIDCEFTAQELNIITNIRQLKVGGVQPINELDITQADLIHDGHRVQLLDTLIHYAGTLVWLPLSDGRILQYCKKKHENKWTISNLQNSPISFTESSFNYRYEQFTVIKSTFANGSIFIHYKIMKIKQDINNPDLLPVNNDSERYLFQYFKVSNGVDEQLTADNQNPNLICFVQLEPYQYSNVNATVFSSNGPLIAIGKNLKVFAWNVANKSFYIKVSRKSDITALEEYHVNNISRYVYCGCRNGYLYSIPFSQDSYASSLPESRRMQCYKNIRNISSIISLKSFKDGRLLLSSIKRGMSSQYLFIIDTLHLESMHNCEKIPAIILKTNFNNMTKETEHLSISEDQQYVCYGKGDDFEIFSLRHRVYNNDESYTCYPFATFKDYIRNDKLVDLSKYRLVKLTFSEIDKEHDEIYIDNMRNYSNLKLLYRIENNDVILHTKQAKIPIITLSFEYIHATHTSLDIPLIKLISLPIV